MVFNVDQHTLAREAKNYV